MTNFYKSTRVLAVAAIVAGTSTSLLAQKDAAALIQGGLEDANGLMTSYASPLMKSIGSGLNAGWFQTAKPHGIGGFDLTFSLNVPFAPTADQSYDASGFKNVKLDPSNTSTTSPTIFGEGKEGPKMNVIAPNPLHKGFADNFPGAPNPYQKDTAIASFNLPQGAGINYFPVPTAQLSVGVGFGTEVSVRFIPTVTASDAKIGLFGFAVKHDFKQWIPGMKELPFDLSAMFGYTNLNLDYGFSGDNAISPESGPDIQPDQSGKTFDNQKLTLTSKAWTTNVIISKKLGPFTPYLGVGYQAASTTLKLEGDYPITSINENYDPAALPGSSNSKIKKIDAVTDPISITGDISGFRANAGFRLKLAVLTIHADYTLGKYNVASVGLGINLQSIVPFKL
jgi:hypothetical protein